MDFGDMEKISKERLQKSMEVTLPTTEKKKEEEEDQEYRGRKEWEKSFRGDYWKNTTGKRALWKLQCEATTVKENFPVFIRPRSYRQHWQLKRNGNSTETRVAENTVSCLQSQVYKGIYTESTPYTEI